MKPRTTISTLSILKGIASWGGVITTLAGVAYGVADGVSILSYCVTLSGVALTSTGHIIGHVQARHQRAATAEAAARIAEARADAAAAKASADDLMRRATNRVITEEQRSQLLTLLDNGPKGHVVVTFLSVERDAQKLAEQITSVLTEAGFDVTLSKNIWLQLALDGIYIAAKEKDVVPQHGIFIQKCFKDAGIHVGGFYDPEFLTEVGAADDSIVFAISNRH